MLYLEENQFSAESLITLNKEISQSFLKFENDNIVRRYFYMHDNEEIHAVVLFFTQDYLHQVKFRFNNLSESWSFIPHSVRNLNEKRPL